MFTKSKYFFEPLVETELNMMAQTKSEYQLMRQIILNHLIFACLSQTKEPLRPTIIFELQENLFHPMLIEKLNQLNPNINQELLERSLSFILSNIQSRLENANN